MIAEIQRQVAALTTAHAELRADLERLKRDAKWQVAPFSKGTRVEAETPCHPSLLRCSGFQQQASLGVIQFTVDDYPLPCSIM